MISSNVNYPNDGIFFHVCVCHVKRFITLSSHVVSFFHVVTSMSPLGGDYAGLSVIRTVVR